MSKSKSGEPQTEPECKEGNDNDSVCHPNHYTSHPSGVECIDIIKHMNFCKGTAIKYIWRAGLKDDEIKDLQKAIKLLQFEIERLQGK